LFKLRLESDDATEKERFLQTLDLDLERVTAEEKQAHRDDLVAANPWVANSVDTEPFFKVSLIMPKRD
jgi:DNA primase large subunit